MKSKLKFEMCLILLILFSCGPNKRKESTWYQDKFNARNQLLNDIFDTLPAYPAEKYCVETDINEYSSNSDFSLYLKNYLYHNIVANWACKIPLLSSRSLSVRLWEGEKPHLYEMDFYDGGNLFPVQNPSFWKDPPDSLCESVKIRYEFEDKTFDCSFQTSKDFTQPWFPEIIDITIQQADSILSVWGISRPDRVEDWDRQYDSLHPPPKR